MNSTSIPQRSPGRFRFYIDLLHILSKCSKAQLETLKPLLEGHCDKPHVGRIPLESGAKYDHGYRSFIKLSNLRPTAIPILAASPLFADYSYRLCKIEAACDLSRPDITDAQQTAKRFASVVLKTHTSTFISVFNATASKTNQRKTRESSYFDENSGTYYWNSGSFTFVIYSRYSKQARYACPGNPHKHGKPIPVVRMEFRLTGTGVLRKKLDPERPRFTLDALAERTPAGVWLQLSRSKTIYVGRLDPQRIKKTISLAIAKVKGHAPTPEEVESHYLSIISDEVFPGVQIDDYAQRFVLYLDKMKKELRKHKGRKGLRYQILKDLCMTMDRNNKAVFLTLNQDDSPLCHRICKTSRES